MNDTIQELRGVVQLYSKKFSAFTDAEFERKPAPGKWSKKEILGHLIDSATNNHQRFIRVQFENKPTIFYDQDNWVHYNHYNDLPTKQLIRFWTIYNKHLVEVIKRIPEENLLNQCKMKNGKYVTLDFLINDYVVHVEHHIRQIFD